MILDHADLRGICEMLAGILVQALTSISGAFGEQPQHLLGRMRSALVRYGEAG